MTGTRVCLYICGTIDHNVKVRSERQYYRSAYDLSLIPADGAVDGYISSLNYVDGSPQALEMIGDQIWLGKWFNWWDAWPDWRRTGYPVLVPTIYPSNSTGGSIPRKLFLPMHELAANGANVEEGATSPGDSQENFGNGLVGAECSMDLRPNKADRNLAYVILLSFRK